MAKVTDLVAQLAQPLAEAAGCSLWDVEYVKEAGTWYLRIYIDKESRCVHRRLRGGVPPPVRRTG